MDQRQGRDRQRLKAAHAVDQRREHLAALIGVGPGKDVDIGATAEEIALRAPDQRPGVGALHLRRRAPPAPRRPRARTGSAAGRPAPGPRPPHRAPAAPDQPSCFSSLVSVGAEPIRAGARGQRQRLFAPCRPRPRTGRPPARPAARRAPGPPRFPSSAASSIATQQRAGRPVAAPVERRGDHLPGQVEVRLDHLVGGERPAAAGREPVGDREQGDVGGDRLGRAQVLVDAARRQRRLVDEEAEPQVVEGQRLQMVGEAAAGAQPGAERADRSRPPRGRGR